VEVIADMKIIVPIKQVPETSNVKMDPESGTIIRSGSNAVVNPLDLYAIEAALQLRDQSGGSVTAISMGPPSATKALREAVAMGCENACLISDRQFGGSDTWATSYVISKAVENLGDFDLIICGERATDGDTAQVGPGIAAWLDIPLATYVSKVEVSEESSSLLSAERLVEDGYQQLALSMPALITVVKEIAEPRLPTLEGKKKAVRTDIPVLTAADMNLDPSYLGLKGSPTKVLKITTPQVSRGGRILEAGDGVSAAVSELIRFLKEKEIV
jgi:electron transfer flavoprotein beta subunit